MSVALANLVAPAYPIRKGPRGYVARAVGADVIRQSVEQILATEPGERVNRPTFGCATSRWLFTPDDAAMAVAIDHEVREALGTWEPRIAVSAVEVVRDSVNARIARLTVSYAIRSTKQQDSATVQLLGA